MGSLNLFQGTAKFQNVLLKGLSKSLQQDNADSYLELITLFMLVSLSTLPKKQTEHRQLKTENLEFATALARIRVHPQNPRLKKTPSNFRLPTLCLRLETAIFQSKIATWNE